MKITDISFVSLPRLTDGQAKAIEEAQALFKKADDAVAEQHKLPSPFYIHDSVVVEVPSVEETKEAIVDRMRDKLRALVGVPIDRDGAASDILVFLKEQLIGVTSMGCTVAKEECWFCGCTVAKEECWFCGPEKKCSCPTKSDGTPRPGCSSKPEGGFMPGDHTILAAPTSYFTSGTITGRLSAADANVSRPLTGGVGTFTGNKVEQKKNPRCWPRYNPITDAFADVPPNSEDAEDKIIKDQAMLVDMQDLKAECQRADVERVDQFQDLCRKSVDVLGLKALSKTTGLAPGLLLRYAGRRAYPVAFMRRLALKDVIKVIDARIEKSDFSERSDEDKKYEADIIERSKIPWVGW